MNQFFFSIQRPRSILTPILKPEMNQVYNQLSLWGNHSVRWISHIPEYIKQNLSIGLTVAALSILAITVLSIVFLRKGEKEPLILGKLEKPANKTTTILTEPQTSPSPILETSDLTVILPPTAVAKFKILNQDLILKLRTFTSKPSLRSICNTGMTELLATYTFAEENSNEELDELNDFLKWVIEKALTDQNEDAKLALTLPNNHEDDFESIHMRGGFPQNTPLILLVKANNLKGTELLLLAYEKKDLLFVTPRGNTALHLAILTGQFGAICAMIKRAKELHCLDELLAKKNKAGRSAEDLFIALRTPKNSFDDFLGFANSHFGGEEINKAIIGRMGTNVLFYRNLLLKEIEKVKLLPLDQLKKLNFEEIFK